jgi:hypothetical protein
VDSSQYTFLAACWVIIRKLGKENVSAAARAECSWGLKAEGAQVYADDVVEIVAEAEPSERILVTKLDNKNPVVCTNLDGYPYRWHAETHLITSHVKKLAVSTKV